jgi:hypothetical protein
MPALRKQRFGEIVLVVSIVGLAAELAVAVTTLLPSAPVVADWIVFALFPPIFFVHLRSVQVLRAGRARSSVGAVLRDRPTAVRVAFCALFITAWVIALGSITHLAGQPTVVHGKYFLNDHGDLMPVTYNGYRHAVVLQQRIFTLIPGVFYALGIVINWPARGERVYAVSAINPA